MSKLKTRKRITTLSLALLFTLISGTVFAFANGLLTLNGSVILNPNLIVVWDNPEIDFAAADGDRVRALNLWYYADDETFQLLPGSNTLDAGAYFGEWGPGGDSYWEWAGGDEIEPIWNPEDRGGYDTRFAELLISPDGQYARLRAELAAPGDLVIATLDATNIGSVDAFLENVLVTGDAADHVAITFDVDSAAWDAGLALPTGTTTATSITITIGWGDPEQVHFFATDGLILDFEITVDYSFYVG